MLEMELTMVVLAVTGFCVGGPCWQPCLPSEDLVPDGGHVAVLGLMKWQLDGMCLVWEKAVKHWLAVMCFVCLAGVFAFGEEGETEVFGRGMLPRGESFCSGGVGISVGSTAAGALRTGGTT